MPPAPRRHIPAARPPAWQAGLVTDVQVRAATEDDLAAIAAVAAAPGQVEEWSGSDPGYVRHLLAHGRGLGAGPGGAGPGSGATRRVGDGPAPATLRASPVRG